MFGTTAKRATLVAVSLALAAFTQIPAAHAADVSAQEPTISINSPAGLSANGAGVGITVTVRCPVDSGAYISAQITQIGPEGYPVHGSGYGGVTCTGHPVTVPVGLLATSFDGYPVAQPLQLGSAFVSATVQYCNEFACDGADTTRSLQVKSTPLEQPNFSSPIVGLQLPKTATIQGGGAGVVVLVPYKCGPTAQGFIQASLGQLTDDGYVALSGASMELRCTPQKRSGVLAFHALTSAWVPGSAFIVLDGSACDDSLQQCVEPTPFRTLKIVA